MPQLKETKKKQGRRGNNEGSIHQRKDGSWCGQVTTGYKTDGKPIRKTVYGKSRQEVARKVNTLAEQVNTNGYITESARQERNFEILCREWFDLFVAPTISSKTAEARRLQLKNHIFPAFGKYEVNKIDLIKLQKFFNEKSDKYASDTVHKLKNLLNNFFKYAVERKYISANPMANVKVKKFESRPANDDSIKAIKPDVREALLEAVETNPLLKPIVITSAYTGLRPQEICALRWDSISFSEKTLSVKAAVVRKTEFDENWNVVSRSSEIGKTKTPKSVRRFTMPEVVIAVLREWQVYCEENNIISEYVFPNTKTGEFRKYSGLRSILQKFVKKHGLEDEKISLYSFRHTFATILLEEGTNPKNAAEMMGHAKTSTFLDFYCHNVSDALYEQAARTMDSVHAKLEKNKNPTGCTEPVGV